jgi:hypothetical protein
MPVNAGLAWDRVGEVLLIVHAARTPSDAEWDQMMASPEAHAPGALIVISNGVKPTPRQRGDIQQHFGKIRSAILTDSVITRGAITALSWFGMLIRGFEPADEAGAFDFVRVHQAERARISARLEELNARVAAA